MSVNLKSLESYYEKNHKNKIFFEQRCDKAKKYYILYDYSKEDEIEKFVSNFTEYLPYYVYNADSLESIDPKGGIGKRLAETSKTCWNGPTVPKRDLKVNGIFGEVFLDFYERIVKKGKLASTYASRRNFKSRSENKGFDNVLFAIYFMICTMPLERQILMFSHVSHTKLDHLTEWVISLGVECIRYMFLELPRKLLLIILHSFVGNTQR